ncbi:MAG: hypothetical protein PHI66_02815 [Candidatus Pacebacteria bacterium]|nr:hypothetical protein [Candidatus Paceibacterota bacterium]
MVSHNPLKAFFAGLFAVLLVLSFYPAVSAAEDVESENGDVVESGELSDGSPYSLIKAEGDIVVSLDDDASFRNQMEALGKAIKYDGEHDQVLPILHKATKKVSYKKTSTSSPKKRVIKARHRN